MTSCPKKHCLVSVIALFVFMYVYEMIVHGHLLMGMYEQTAALWRPQADMAQYAPWFLLRYALLAMVVTCLYKKLCHCAPSAACQTGGEPMKKTCPYQKALCFGMKIGMIMGIMQASAYIYMPIPGSLAVAWFVASMVEGLGFGVILALLCKKKDGSCATKDTASL